MEYEKIVIAYDKVMKRPYRRPCEDWKILFDYYNSQNTHLKPLHMSCMSCYTKVQNFVMGMIAIEQKKIAESI